jgi:hypothetical protein
LRSATRSGEREREGQAEPGETGGQEHGRSPS